MASTKCLEEFAKLFPPGSLARGILEWQIEEGRAVDERRDKR